MPKLYNLSSLPPAVFNTCVENRLESPWACQSRYRNHWLSSVLHNHRCAEPSPVHLRHREKQGILKKRIDILLVERGLLPSRERAQAMILAGRVLADEQKVYKSGHAVAEDCAIRLLGGDLRYVSRGGLKLEAALTHWSISLQRAVCMDVGASTGGFTDCMLQSGAASVLAVDTGYGQIDARLRADPRVRLLEKTNARYLQPQRLSEPVEFIAMDVSFISAAQVLPAVLQAAFAERGQLRRELVLLIKPQFEVGRELVGKGGIVRSEPAQLAAVEKLRGAVAALGGQQIEVIDSPILGTEGNREFLLHAVFPSPQAPPVEYKERGV
ncbi:MAG: TlyA family RNA methyltransferase [Candidatus Korobacteraceae bacterium]|jgi:23S rRNA (cytidine1920-2'-O)/16S rRNA (cytidine1409-2'-O)-methyltransferase